MSDITNRPDSWAAQVYRHADPLFRLALLAEGDQDAAEGLVQRAFEWIGPDEASPEVHLLRPLLERRAARPWRLSFGPGEAARSGLTQEQAGALTALLAGLAPPERLVLGLQALRGHDAAALAALLPGLPAPPAQTLGGFRCAAVRALGLLAPQADDALLPALERWLDGRAEPGEALELRRAVLEQPEARAQRDALVAVRQRLAQALPALVAGGAPARLIDDLLGMDEQPRERAARGPRLTRAALGLALAVAALAAAIIAVPAWLRDSARDGSAPPEPAAILERALRRFEQAPLERGVLHERLLVRNRDAAYTIERWYDYASPHRLAVSVQTSGAGAPEFAVSTDGQRRIQYRNWQNSHIDLSVTPAQAAAAVPVLRSIPSAASVFGQNNRPDIAPLYLSQARAAQASSLGQISYQGRPAYLLTYRSGLSLLSGQQEQSARVLLTIDMQTYSLLDVAVLAEGQSESVAQHPLRAELLEVLDQAPADRFTQPSDPADRRDGLLSAAFPQIPSEIVLALEEAGRLDRNLLVPRELPDPAMRGMVLQANESGGRPALVLYYEGEFGSLLLIPAQQLIGRGGTDFADQERVAGGFRYRIARDRRSDPGTLTAEVYQPDAPERRLGVVLADSSATDAEREARLAQTIASLTPLTSQNIAALRERFAASGRAE